MDKKLLIEIPEVYLYDIPPRNERYITGLQRASDWNINNPIWGGRLAISADDLACTLKLNDACGNAFGHAQITEFPSCDLVPVMDSSRYYTLKLRKQCGQTQLVGLGFYSRVDSSAISSALRDYFNKIGESKNLLGQHIKVEPEQQHEQSTSINPFKSEEITEGINPGPSSSTATATRSHFVDRRASIYSPGLLYPPGFIIGPGSSRARARNSCFVDFSPRLNVTRPDSKNPENENLNVFNVNIVAIALEKDPNYSYRTNSTFKCHLCTFTFVDANVLEVHWSNFHNLRRASKCYKCHLPFPTGESRVSHMFRCHTDSDKCGLCGSVFPTPKSLVKHLLCDHECPKFYECGKCGKQFTTSKLLEKHTEEHQRELMNSIAEKGTSEEVPNSNLHIKQEVNEHNLKVELNDPDQCKVKPLPCPLCSATFDCPNLLVAHLRWLHYRKAAACCETCKVAFIGKKSFERHRKQFHVDPTKYWKCAFCHQILKNRFILQYHVREHVEHQQRSDLSGMHLRLEEKPTETRISNLRYAQGMKKKRKKSKRRRSKRPKVEVKIERP